MDVHAIHPSAWMISPFVLLLGLIALAPLAFNAWWQRRYPLVALGLGTVTAAYYALVLHAPTRLLHTASEYTSFIVLIGSLFVVSSGIHISVRGEGTPRENVIFLALGAVVANLLGTTGASMLLIRPWIRLNRYRVTAHHIVFFIFIVSNVGGCLTPIGDPPLFLGYLRGVPFWWVSAQCWPMWLTGVGLLLAMFYWVDRRNYLKAPRHVREALAEPADTWRFQGLHNLAFLAVILGAVFLQKPMFLRETLMAAAAVASVLTTPRHVHKANDFNYHPIREVAILFAGIFATMMPALDYLQTHAAALGTPSPDLFYWGAGSLSSFLDNAPTYLSFLSTSLGAFASPPLVEQALGLVQTHQAGALAAVATATAPHPFLAGTLQSLALYQPAALAAGAVSPAQVEIHTLLGNDLPRHCLVAISVGAVFFGANTYIGNGPNFMVKAIADQQRVHTPSFLGYIARFTLPYMIPMLAVVWWMFFR